MKIFSYIVLLAVLFWNTPDAVAQHTHFANIEFTENKGQWPDEVLFRGEAGNGYVFLTKTGISILQYNKEDYERMSQFFHPHYEGGQGHGNNTSQILRYHVYKVTLPNAKISSASVKGEKPTGSVANYIQAGKNKTAGNGEGCRVFNAVNFDNVYDNVDLRFYSDGGQLKYDFIVKPGGEIEDISMRYEGVSKLQVKQNQLKIRTTVGEVTELYPFTYQSDMGGRKEIEAKYTLKNNEVRFKVDDYNKNAVLVIDPTLVFSTYSGSTSNNWGFTATYGADGSFYGGGIVFGGGFLVSPGAYQTTWGGSGDGFDVGIIKLDALGRNRIYATYIGGSGRDQPHSMVVDAEGNLVVAGRTNSNDFPLMNRATDKIGTGTSGSAGDWDIFVVKLNAAGTGVIGTKQIGGAGNDGVNSTDRRTGPSSLSRNYGDDARSEVILDRNGNVYVASCTQSADFPTRNGFAISNLGKQDGLLMKFNADLSQLLFATRLGGAEDDAAFVLAENPFTGNIFVAGATASDNISGAVTAVQRNRLAGQIDGYVAEITPDGNSLVRFCYYGTALDDVIYGIQFDRAGFPYIMGTTMGMWERTSNVLFFQNGGKQFVSKLTQDLTGYVYSTTFGSGTKPNISPTAFLVDRCENIYVSGWGGILASGYNVNMEGTEGLPVSPDAYKSITDDQDFYFIVIKRNAESLLYGSFFGQDGGIAEHVDGGTSRFDANGVIYQAICANCNTDPNSGPPRPEFPGTAGSWSPQNGAGTRGCNLGMVKISFNYAGVGASPSAFINGRRDSSGCIPLVVDFRDNIRNATSYEWNFGDGSPDVTTTSFTVQHTFTAVGTYRVRLIAIDPQSCNVRDTAYLTIEAGDNRAALALNIEKLDPCEALNYRFDNLSLAPTGFPFGPTTFAWDFGDGTAIVPTSNASVTHSYASPGTYNGALILLDDRYCNYPDTLRFTLRVSSVVEARIETPPTGCAPYDAVFNNVSLAGQDFYWDFGDGSTSREVSPTHRFENPGTYTIRLRAVDPNTCNLEDETTVTITVFQKPTAAFSYSPVEPIENTPVDFFNASSTDGIRYKWLFGDGDSLITIRRDTTVRHQYNATGTFLVQLITYNAGGCTDTATQEVRAIVLPLVDVPSAFVPQGDARVNTVYVVGFGIAKMRFRIYNRWGQLVFESTDRRQGWNGTYKGAVQPMDVYAYTLEVEFFDGTKTTKKGDITLMR
ncbi:MAG: PKD domain-containing protein [Chitinophagaceae bacterium]